MNGPRRLTNLLTNLWLLPILGALAALSGTAHAVELSVSAHANSDATDIEVGEPEAGTSLVYAHDRSVVNVGQDSMLPAGESADDVVAVFGNATSNGDVSDSVVAVLGNAIVTGSVGDSVVSIFGDNTIDGSVGSDAVAVFGNLRLGPDARLGGDAVSVGGHIERDPGAKVTGQVVSVLGNLGGLAPHLKLWVQHCLFYGRPLAFEPGLGWAWSIAAAVLAFYLLVAALGGQVLARCVRTVETHPGHTVLAALASWVLVPAAYLLLIITIVGIVAVPFLGLAIFAASVFGRIIMLAWFGRLLLRLAGERAREQMVLAVLVGGVLVALLYAVPVLGYLLFALIGWLGFGAVLATLFLALKARSATRPAGGGAPATAGTSGEAVGTPGSGPAAEPGDAQVTGAASAATGAATTIIDSSAERASFGIRLLALLIDMLLVGVVVANAPFVHSHGGAFLLAIATYGTLMWRYKGTTVGGIVLRTRVVRLDGRPVDWATAIVRGLGCLLSILPLGLGFIWIGFDAQRQAWHDKLAGTVVVRVPQGIALV